MTPSDFIIPQAVKLITAGCDFQIDRAELEFVGWSDGEESWGLGNVMLPGDFTKLPAPDRPWAYDQIEAQMIQVFEREDGARLSVAASGWDTGYAAAQRALYAYLRPRLSRRFYAMKGSSQKWGPMWVRGRRDERVTLFIIGTNRMKKLIYDRASISIPGPGYMHYPKHEALGYDEEWFKQLLAEDSHSEFHGGVQMTVFEMPATPPENGTSHNEALDKRVMATAALYIRGPVNWEMEEELNIASIPKSEEETRADRQRQTQPRRRRTRWMNWRA